MYPVLDTLKREIAAVDGVTSVGMTDIGIATGNNQETNIYLPGAEAVGLDVYNVDAGFFETMGIGRLAGRLFDPNRPADDITTPYPENPAAERALVARGANVVINELAARRLGFRSPEEAIGKHVERSWEDDYGGVLPITIIGVVEDSPFRSIRQPVEPIMFFHCRFGQNWLLVRYSSTDPGAMRRRVEAVWKDIAPDVPFEAEFSEQIVGELYETEAARAQTFAAFALLAVVVACLGLFDRKSTPLN